MTRVIMAAMLTLTITPTSASAVTFDWAYVGNAGNVGDVLLQFVFGSVDYDYRISKHEVTNAQYVEFLNAVAATDNFGGSDPSLYSTDMSSSPRGGIVRNGAAGAYTYSIKPDAVGQGVGGSDSYANKPVNYVSFFDAMRFTNWLHNGQGSGGTETGAYIISDGISEVRLADARFFIPSQNEWYKAAYHDASTGTNGVYFDYATASDSVPVSDQPGDNPSAVNYFNHDGLDNGFNDGFAVSGSTSHPYQTNTNLLTDVGSYTAAASPYGTFDQNGNLDEWNEAVIRNPILIGRGTRGGSWSSPWFQLQGYSRRGSFAEEEYSTLGFRVATVVPEPRTLLLGAFAAAGLLVWRRLL